MSLDALLVSAAQFVGKGSGLSTEELVALYGLEDEKDVLWGVDWTQHELDAPRETAQIPPSLAKAMTFTITREEISESTLALAHLSPLSERFSSPSNASPPPPSTLGAGSSQGKKKRKRSKALQKT